MLNKLLQIYENKIINERTKRDLGWFGWTYIIISILCLILFLVFELLHLFIGAIISIGMLVVSAVVFSMIANRIFKTDEQALKLFRKETIDKFSDILKNADLDSKDMIQVMIKQCKKYEKTKSDFFMLDPFKSVFTMLIYPIITAVAAIIVKNMSDEYMIEWSIFIIGMIVVVYVMVALIYPILSNYTNKYKKIAKMMREDLEYILVMKK